LLNESLAEIFEINQMNNMNGMVKKAQLSGIDLFPTFVSWCRSNAFLILLSLITTIFGGVFLMYMAKKKN